MRTAPLQAAVRPLVSRLAVASMAATGVVAGSLAAPPGPAFAAPTCAVSDSYSQLTLSPTDAGQTAVAGARFGAAVVSADFNKDGFPDLAVGSPGDQVNGAASGTVMVFLGSATGLRSGRRLIQADWGAGDEAGDQFGASLAAGDFNKDGFADLAIGTPGEQIGTIRSGSIAVYPGNSSGLGTPRGFDQGNIGQQSEAGDEFGTALAAGDFNGDGFTDLAVGAPGEIITGTVRSGQVQVLKGATGGLAFGWLVDQASVPGGNENGDRFGAALAAGNITGSSHADLAIGAPNEAPGTATTPTSGVVYVLPGAASGKGTMFSRSQVNNGGGDETGDQFGATLSTGNFDKDAYTDIVVGSPGEAPGPDPRSGTLTILPGAATEVSNGYALQQRDAGDPSGADDRFAAAVATGDVNGDGYADLLAGIPGRTRNGQAGTGSTMLWLGRPRNGTAVTPMQSARRIVQTDVSGVEARSDAFGSAVALSDLNRDGRADAIIGASGDGVPGEARSGVAVVLSRVIPVAATQPTEQFTPTTVVQSPGTGGGGPLDYAYTDNIGRLLLGHQPDADDTQSVQWTAVQDASAAFVGQPALGRQTDGRLQVAVRTSKGEVWTRAQDAVGSATWGPWLNVGGPNITSISMATQPDGALVILAVDNTGAFWALPQSLPYNPWGAWFGLGVTGLAGTAAGASIADGVRVLVRDQQGTIRTGRYAAGSFTGCTAVGEVAATGNPAVVTYPGSRVRVFTTGTGGELLTNVQDASGAFAGTWSVAKPTGTVGSPSALVDPISGRTEAVTRGEDGGVFRTTEAIQGSGTWSDSYRISSDFDVAATDPVAFPYASSRGTQWAFVIRLSNNQSRFYTPSDNSALTAHSLPKAP